MSRLLASRRVTVVIKRRFRGPPESGQGGYTAGLLAERISGTGAVAVALRRPPPLDTELDLEERADGSVALLDAGELVAEGAPADLELDVPPPVSAEDARAAARRSPWADRHPFPTCFGCGPERDPSDAVAIRTGPLDDAHFAGTWVPLPEFGEPRYTWAALDCPTAAPAVPLDAAPSVLGRLTARLVKPVTPGEPHVVTAWLIGHDGRKHLGGAAIHTADGELCACSEGLWIELRDPASMGAKPR